MPTSYMSKKLFKKTNSLFHNITSLFKKRSENEGSLRDTIEELIEETNEEVPSLETTERVLLTNILDLKDVTADDIMIPRADIIAVSSTATQEQMIAEFARTGVPALIIYNGNLDNVIGIVHTQDIILWMNTGKPFVLHTFMRDVMFVSPSMRAIDLLIIMKNTGTKVAIVVDEYGGVDGLVTFHLLIETVIGDIEGQTYHHPEPQINWKSDGSIIADGRSTIEDLDELVGKELQLVDKDDDIETIAGVVASITGRVPARGEIIKHYSGVEFEILDADPRRVKRVCIKNLSLLTEKNSDIDEENKD